MPLILANAAGVPAYDVTGAAAPDRRTVIYENDFNAANARYTREAGFHHLYTPGAANQCGSTQWISRSGSGRLANICNTLILGQSMSVLRLNNMFGDGLFRLEAMLSIELMNGDTQYPLSWFIGCDTGIEAAASNRRFFVAQFINWNETNSSSVQQWQFDFSNGAATTAQWVPNGSNGAASWVANENKALPYYFAMDFSTVDGAYHGIQWGNQFKVGSLDPTGATATACTALGAITPGTLPNFRNGINICFGVNNRSVGTKTCGQMNMHFARLTKIG